MTEFLYLTQLFLNQINENAKKGIPAKDVIFFLIDTQFLRI